MDPIFVRALKEAKQLLDSGVLTPAEFEEEKKKIKGDRDRRDNTLLSVQSRGHVKLATATKTVQETTGTQGRTMGGRRDGKNLKPVQVQDENAEEENEDEYQAEGDDTPCVTYGDKGKGSQDASSSNRRVCSKQKQSEDDISPSSRDCEQKKASLCRAAEMEGFDDDECRSEDGVFIRMGGAASGAVKASVGGFVGSESQASRTKPNCIYKPSVRKGKSIGRTTGGKERASEEEEQEEEDLVSKNWREKAAGKFKPKGERAKLRQELSELGIDEDKVDEYVAMGGMQALFARPERSAKSKALSKSMKVQGPDDDKWSSSESDVSVANVEDLYEDDEDESQDEEEEYGGRREKIVDLSQHSNIKRDDDARSDSVTDELSEEKSLVLKGNRRNAKIKKKKISKEDVSPEEEDDEEVVCNECGEHDWEPGNEIYICDGECGKGYHFDCFPNTREQKRVKSSGDDEDWHCWQCVCGSMKNQGQVKGNCNDKRNAKSSPGRGTKESSSSGEDSDVGKGNKKKNIRKPKKLDKEMLRLAAEGQKAEEQRSELKSEAEIEKGGSLVLLKPTPGQEEDTEVLIGKSVSKYLQTHQRAGVKFAWECLVRQGKGCILAHCMGLGKSLQVVSLLYAVMQKDHGQASDGESVMIVAPVNTLENWSKEFEKWLPTQGSSPTVFQLTYAGLNTATRLGMLKEWHQEGGVLLVGYEQYRNLSVASRIKNKKQRDLFREYLVDPGPSMVVCDEGHVLRNSKSGIAQAMSKLKTMRRLVLSGTPLQNNLKEYHCMVDFVRPGLLGSERVFSRDFIQPILNGQCVDSTPQDVKQMRQRSHVLHGLLKVCVDRADYRVLSSYLPPKHEYVIAVRLSRMQCSLYRSFVDKLRGEGGLDVVSEIGIRSKVFEAYHTLAKVWTHPGVLTMEHCGGLKSSRHAKDSMEDFVVGSDDDSDSDYYARGKKQKIGRGKSADRRVGIEASHMGTGDKVEGSWWKSVPGAKDLESIDEECSGKLMFLIHVLEEAGLAGDKVLVFSQSLMLLDCIELMLESWAQRDHSRRCWIAGRDYFRLDGSVESSKRQIWIDEFNRSKNKRARLFLISTRAGGLGVNLVAANRVVIMDASWNPSHDKQALFRAYRFGQTKNTYVYRLLAHGTMEEKIYGRQVTKQALASRVVDSEETGRVFTQNELSELFKFEPGDNVETVASAISMSARATARAASEDKGSSSSRINAVVVNATFAEQRPDGLLTSRMWEGVGAPPADALLAKVLSKLLPTWIVGYHEAESLVEMEADLSAEEAEAAWMEYRNAEEKAKEQRAMTFSGPSTGGIEVSEGPKEQQVVLNVVVPEGVAQGGQFYMEFAGKRFLVTAPPGSGPGTTLQLSISV